MNTLSVSNTTASRPTCRLPARVARQWLAAQLLNGASGRPTTHDSDSDTGESASDSSDRDTASDSRHTPSDDLDPFDDIILSEDSLLKFPAPPPLAPNDIPSDQLHHYLLPRGATKRVRSPDSTNTKKRSRGDISLPHVQTTDADDSDDIPSDSEHAVPATPLPTLAAVPKNELNAYLDRYPLKPSGYIVGTRLTQEQRKHVLESHPWVSSFDQDAAVCGLCGVPQKLDKVTRYGPHNVTKHWKTCSGLKRQYWAEREEAAATATAESS